MSQFTATAPNGQVLVRNTKSHTYNYAVIIMVTEENVINRLQSIIASNERSIAECADRPGHEGYVARLIKETAKCTKALATAADTWYDIAWRRDMASAQQEAGKMQESINKGYHSACSVLVVETTQTK